MTSYLWPMHEGERKPEDFIAMADGLENGIFVLTTHSWHICETYSKGKSDDPSVKKNIDDIRTILEVLMDRGFRVGTMSESVL